MRATAIIVRVGIVLAAAACSGALIAFSADSVPENVEATRTTTAAEKISPSSKVIADWRYQRVQVPADRPEDWPRDKLEHYLPMPVKEFDEQLAQIRGEPAVTPASATSQFLRADYSARLDRDELVSGQVAWEFQHRGSQRDTVVLGDCGLALADFMWQQPRNADNGNSGAARSGGPGNSPAGGGNDELHAIVGNDEYGRVAAIVDRNGTVNGKWSLRGQRDADGSLLFALRLPACAINTLSVTLPTNMKASVNQGFVTSSNSSDADHRLWKIELGGTGQATLRISRNIQPAEIPNQCMVRGTSVYRLSVHGIELMVDFELQRANAQGQQFELLVDRPLVLASTRVDDAQVIATPDNAVAATDETRKYFIDIPAASRSDKVMLRVIATAPLTLEKPARLPLVRLAGGRWESGNARLEIASPLVLSEFSIDDCQQTIRNFAEPYDAAEKRTDAPTIGFPHAANSASGDKPTADATAETNDTAEPIDLQLFNDHPVIEVGLSQRSQQINVTQGTALMLRANEGSAQCRAKFSIDTGELFGLEAEVAPMWIIESVDSVPAGMVADWSQQFVFGHPGRLRVQLSSPLSPAHEVFLLVTARRRRVPWGDTFRTDDLALLRFPMAEHRQRRIVEVQTAEAYQLQLRGAAELQRLDPAKLTGTDAALLPESPTGLVFIADEEARSLAVSLNNRAAQFEADIQAEAIVDDENLTETYRFSITPQGREVGRFTVRFSQPRTAPVTWSIEGKSGVSISSRKLSQSELPSTSFAGGEVWELSLPTVSTTQVVILGQRTTALTDDMPVALASIGEAEAQRGTVQIRSIGRNLPEVVSRQKVIPVDPAPAGQYATAVAAFRYDPEEDVLLSAEPPLSITLHHNAIKPAWIWQTHLDSRLDRASSQHVLTCQVENTGRSQIQFVPPTGAHDQQAWVNDQPLAAFASENGLWKVNLPPGARFATIILKWIDDQSLASALSARTATWPRCDVPMLNRTWTLWLPPGHKVIDAQCGGVHTKSLAWITRLLGPFSPDPIGLVANFPPSGTSASAAVGLTHSPGEGLAAPWHISDAQPLDTANWTAYQFEGVGDSDTQIWVAQASVISAWQWSLFLLALAGRWWLGRSRPLVDITLLGGATSLALLTPTLLAPFSGGVWMGLVVGLLFVHCWPKTKATAETTGDNVESNSATGGLTATLTAVLLLLLICGRSLAAADHSQLASDGDRITSEQRATWRVLFPVDGDGKPVGDLCYLPEQFYNNLRQLRSELKISTPRCLITRAQYRAMPTEISLDRTAVSSTWQADFEIESLAENVSVALPLGFEGASLIPDGVRLDDQPTPFHAAADRHRLDVDVPHAGPHRLEVLFRPIEVKHSIDFAVPRVAQSYVTFATRIAGEDSSVELKSAIGSESKSNDGQERVWLGMAKHITLEPHTNSELLNTAAEAPMFDVEQFDWLHIQPGSVTVDARFHINVQAGRLQQLKLSVDPRWQAAALPDGTITRAQQNKSSPEVMIELSRPIVGQAVVDASFILPKASGIGFWQPPTVMVAGAHSTRHWQGISVDPALAYEVSGVPQETVMTPEKFAARWSSGEVKPQMAWQQSTDAPRAIVSTKPREGTSSASYQLAAVANSHEMLLRLAARVTSTIPVFHYTLSPPTAMEIESVTLQDQNGKRRCHWSRSAGGTLTIFPDAPISSLGKLLIVGSMPLSAEGNFVLPTLRIEHCTSAGFSILLARRRDALVKLTDSAGMSVVTGPKLTEALAQAQQEGLLASSALGDERVLTMLQDPHDFRPITAHIDRNNPQIKVTQITTMNRQSDAWTAAVDADLSIEHGVVDTLRFDLPANWIGPFEVSPLMTVAIEDVPGENRRQLVLRPEMPLALSAKLRISGPLTVSAGQRPTAPDVRLTGAASQTLYFMLPRRQENQQLKWDIRRLIPTRQLPDALSNVKPDFSSYLVYQLLGDHPRASLRSAQRASENARVRMADISISWSDDGSCAGVVGFDLESAGATSCELVMPDDSRLIDAKLDGAAAQLTTFGEHHISVWLGDNKLPRRLEVAFAGHAERESEGWRLTAPSLVGLPVERTLWTIAGPNGTGVGKIAEEPSVSPQQHALLRLEQTAALADSAAALLVDEPVDDVARWYKSWKNRFMACRTMLLHALSRSADNDERSNIAAQIAQADQQQARLESRLAVENNNEQIAAMPQMTADDVQLAQLTHAADSSLTFATMRSETSAITIAYPGLPSDDSVRLIGGLLIGLATVGIVWIGRRARA